MGRWPILVNAIFNSLAHYFFILGIVLVFIPIFAGKLSILRDIFASQFFRPLARISYSALLISSLMLFFIFFTHEQSIYYDHKNMMFIFFSLVFFTYTLSVFIALFLEYPFRTMAKVVFSPPKKILRLNRELARVLNTNNVRDCPYDDTNSEPEESMEVAFEKEQQKQRDMFDDVYEEEEQEVSGHVSGRFGSGNTNSKQKIQLDLTLPINENLKGSRIGETSMLNTSGENYNKNINATTYSMLTS
jgi:hypothetical protein